VISDYFFGEEDILQESCLLSYLSFNSAGFCWKSLSSENTFEDIPGGYLLLNYVSPPGLNEPAEWTLCIAYLADFCF